MIQPSEEAILILIKENDKFSTSRRITKIFTFLDQMGLKGFSPHEDETALQMISCKEYHFEYLIISLEYDDLDFYILKCKQYFPNIGILVAYDKSTPDKDKMISDLQEKYKIKSFLDKSSLSLQNLTYFLKQIRTDQILHGDAEKTNQRYTFIHHISTGSTGKVDLYTDNQNKRLIAVKNIQTLGMTREAKDKVGQEVELMKKVKAPTIIEFYDSEIENEYRNIYMEFADQGTLETKIKQCKLKGEPLSVDQILDWMIEIFIALHEMNKRNLIHRDIKAENILLKKLENSEEIVAKLSDLGISREKDMTNKMDLTLCGTPYYVSPEIASDIKNYNFNTDIWSLGCVLYEMATLKKPFGEVDENGNQTDSQTLSMGDLYEIIRSRRYPKLTQVDKRIKFLIKFMLIKDPHKRFDLLDIMKIDFVIDRTMELIKKYNWEDKINDLEEYKNLQKNKVPCYKILDLIENSDLELMRDALKMFEFCEYTSFKKSFYSGSYTNTISGLSLIEAFERIHPEPTEDPDNDKLEFFRQLIEKEILIPINVSNNKPEEELFFNPDKTYFIFSFDNIQNTHIDNNPVIKNSLLKLAVYPHYDLLSISQFVLEQGKQLLKLFRNDTDDISRLYGNQRSIKFIVGIQSFQNFNIMDLPYTNEDKSREICLLNIYQIMFIQLIFQIHSERSNKKEPIITYKFKDYQLTNLEIKHVIFRNNKKPPGNYFRLVYNTDAKTQILPNFNDLKVLFILYDFNFDIMKYFNMFRFKIFKKKAVDIQINRMVLKFIYRNLVITENQNGENILLFPSYIENYVQDFNSSDTQELPQQLLKFLYDCYRANRNEKIPQIYRLKTDEKEEELMKEIFGNLTQLVRQLQSKKLKIKYSMEISS